MKKITVGILTFIGVLLANSALAQKVGESLEAGCSDSGWLVALPITLSILVALLIMGLALVGAIFWVMMIIDIAKHEKNNDLAMWLVLILLFGVPVAIVYYFVKKRPREKAVK